MDYYQQSSSSGVCYSNLTKQGIESRLEELEVELNKIKTRITQQEMEIESIENLALRQRLQDILDRLLQEQDEKQREQYTLQELLKQAM